MVETGPTPPVTVPVCQWPAPTSGTCDGWQFTMPLNTSFCIPYKEWIKDVFFGVDQVLGGAVDYIAARVVTALTFTPPDIGAAVGSIYDTMDGLATEILVLLFTLEATRVVLSIVTSLQHGEALAALRRAIWALAMIQVLKPAMDAWIGSANAIAGAVVGNGTGGGAAGVLEALNLTAFLSQGAIVEVIFFVLAIAVAVLLVVITVQRLCGLFLLACLYAVAPACLACWIAPETRSIARWWFGSFLCYSLYGVAYAVMLSVDAALLTNVRSFSGDRALPAAGGHRRLRGAAAGTGGDGHLPERDQQRGGRHDGDQHAGGQSGQRGPLRKETSHATHPISPPSRRAQTRRAAPGPATHTAGVAPSFPASRRQDGQGQAARHVRAAAGPAARQPQLQAVHGPEPGRLLPDRAAHTRAGPTARARLAAPHAQAR